MGELSIVVGRFANFDLRIASDGGLVFGFDRGTDFGLDVCLDLEDAL